MTHSLQLNTVYELPFGRGKRFWAGAPRAVGYAISGWEISGIAVFSSGFPFSVTQSGDRAGVGGGTQRPDVVGKAAILGGVDQFFDRFDRE